MQFIHICILFTYDYLTEPSANHELEIKRKEAAVAWFGALLLLVTLKVPE